MLQASGSGKTILRSGAIMSLSLSHYLILGAILFAISIVGIFFNRKNIIVLLMAIELMLLAVNMNFIAFSLLPWRRCRTDFCVLHLDGRRCGIRDRPCHFGGALFRTLDTINVEDLDTLKG
jgi:NADH-quinone oxidoreductase subunit K